MQEERPVPMDPVSYGPPADFYAPRRAARRIPWTNIVLFLLTVVATTTSPGGVAYGVAIMTILLAHEMGHYLVARRYGVRATLPFFLPMPFSPMGTLGAVILMPSRIPNRTALFDIGIAGPLAGLVVTIPAILIGLGLSDVVPLGGAGESGELLGGSFLFSFLSRIVKGDVGDDFAVQLHPIAFAGWFGLLVTALNLLPVSQLDGGHVLYGLLGKRSKRVAYAIYAAFLLMAIVKFRYWIPFAVLVLFLRPEHPPTIDPVTPISRGRKMLAVFAFVLFILSWSPDPFHFG